MQGQIVRVSGKFNNSNLPKLSDFDTSYLIQEILNHEACISFYDFTDKSTMTFSDNKVISVEDKKGRNPFNSTSLELAPIFNDSYFNGRGGVLFNGAEEGSIQGFYPANQAISIDLFAQITITPTDNSTFKVFISSATQASNALYYRNTFLSGYNGNFAIIWDGAKFQKNRYTTVHDYRSGVSPNVSLYLNDIKGTHSGTASNSKPTGALNIGRWATASAANYGNFIIGSLILLDGNVREDAYLDALLDEFYKRQYNK